MTAQAGAILNTNSAWDAVDWRTIEVLQAIDVDQLIEPEHRARCIWEFVGRLNLDSFYDDIRSVEGCAGRSALNPHLLISLWIYAYSRSIGSAREIARLCEIDPAFQWLTGMDSINHHTLSDFRVDHRSEEHTSELQS